MASDAPRPESPSGGGRPDRRHRDEAAPGTTRRRVRPAPIGRLLLYYVVVIALLVLLAWAFPIVRNAYLSPIDTPIANRRALDLITEGGPGVVQPLATGPLALHAALVRTVTTFLVVIGALVLALPVAWVYTVTKRLRYEGSLVQSIIILPVVVTGILMIVKNSVAIAFGLAGIVAAVRFRNTLKDPKDAVYIFLVLGIGIAAGVQALDIAIVLSLAFNVIVLALWKYNVGAIYSQEYGPRGILNVGDRRLMVAQSSSARQEVRARAAREADGMKSHGVLLVHTASPEPARHAVEALLGQVAKDWKLTAERPGPSGTATLEYLVELKKKSSVVELLGELDDRWAAQVSAAEFVPYNARTTGDDDEEED